ncbi:YbaK/EbsC family protein, partial [archaeon]
MADIEICSRMPENRVSALIKRIENAERRVGKLENGREDPSIARVKQDLRCRGIYSTSFLYVPTNYYDYTLEERAKLLGGHVPQLCKSILFENTAWEGENEFDPTNARYYLVITQYVAKINTTTLRNFIQSLRGTNRLSKSSFNFQLAPDSVSFQLTGFAHNAISPFGLVEKRIPIVICTRCTQVSPSMLYLGGGRVDVKLCLSVGELVEKTGAVVG